MSEKEKLKARACSVCCWCLTFPGEFHVWHVSTCVLELCIFLCVRHQASEEQPGDLSDPQDSREDEAG